MSRTPNGSPRATADATTPTNCVNRVPSDAVAGGSRRKAANQQR
jgi:hypothetical protein